jgi:hypothetical protein
LDHHEFLFFIITQTLFLESFSLRQANYSQVPKLWSWLPLDTCQALNGFGLGMIIQ